MDTLSIKEIIFIVSVSLLQLVVNTNNLLWKINILTPPIVSVQDNFNHIYNPDASGMCYTTPPVIYLNNDKLEQDEMYYTFLHEYMHRQQALKYSPLGFTILYWFEDIIHGYTNNRFELEQFKFQTELQNPIWGYSWDLGKFTIFSPEFFINNY